MSDDLAGKAVSALADLADALQEWAAAAATKVQANLAAVPDGPGLGDLAAWSVDAASVVMQGVQQVGEALLDAAVLFETVPPRSTAAGTAGAGGAVEPPVVKTVRVTSTSRLPVPLRLTLTGLRTGGRVDAGKITLAPATAEQPGSFDVVVTVNVAGLVDDVYIGQVRGGPSVTATPDTITIPSRQV
jgi:hypothetical protein